MSAGAVMPIVALTLMLGSLASVVASVVRSIAEGGRNHRHVQLMSF